MNQGSQRLTGFVMTCTDIITTASLAGSSAPTNGGINTIGGIKMSEIKMSPPTDGEPRVGAVQSRHNCKRCQRLRSLYPERLSTCFRLVNGLFSGSQF